jgi:hypothetical protein
MGIVTFPNRMGHCLACCHKFFVRNDGFLMNFRRRRKSRSMGLIMRNGGKKFGGYSVEIWVGIELRSGLNR